MPACSHSEFYFFPFQQLFIAIPNQQKKVTQVGEREYKPVQYYTVSDEIELKPYCRASAILKFELFIFLSYLSKNSNSSLWSRSLSKYELNFNHLSLVYMKQSYEKAPKFGRGVRLSWSHWGSKFSSEILFAQTSRKSSARWKLLQKRKFYTKIRSSRVAEKYINWSKGLAVWLRAAYIFTGIFNIFV